ncbi:nucleotidyltransferase domain-containing protein [Candidatus Woesearchaeota archaeon]|nr:nucleotidyltransferase domain-containing protein [Candidatus Woesearchaeota archaeon]
MPKHKKIIISEVIKELKKDSNVVSIIIFGSYLTKKLANDVDLLLVYKRLPNDWRKRDELALKIENKVLEKGVSLHITSATVKEIKFSIKEGAPLMFGLCDNYKIVYDNDSFFKKEMLAFKGNLKKWKAYKIDKITWEVPALAIKV